MTIRQRAKPFAAPIDHLAWLHLGLTCLVYFGSIAVGTYFWGNWPVVALASLIFAGGSCRFFGVQHDCGHLSYFKSHRMNVIVGVLTGTFTGNPYYAMRYNHNRHHAYIGNLDERASHEVMTWTVDEYLAASPGRRLYYRIYRSPFCIYFLGAIFVIFIRYRIPKNASKTGWWDVVMQNALMFTYWGLAYLLFGWACFAFIILGSMVSACLGVMMVYVGHNYEDAYWENAAECDYEEASLKGSSVLDWGRLWHFMTFNFAYHDLHHLAVRIPAYRLRACHLALSDVLQPTRLGFFEAIGCIQWKLWDESSGKMVRFSDLPQTESLQPAE